MTVHAKGFAGLVAFIFVVVGIVLVVVWRTVGLSPYQPPVPSTQQEMSQELVTLLTEGALREAIEKSGGITSFLHDGEYDSSILLMEPGARDEMKKYTRQVVVRIGQYMTEDELKAFMGVVELPQEMLDSFVNDLFFVRLSEKIVLGVLVNDFVLTSLNHFRLAEFSADSIERVFLEAVLLPDLSIEDSWMSEVLIKGGVVELMLGGHKPYADIGLIALKRSGEKLITVPENYSYERVASNTIEPLDLILYLRPIRGIVSFDIGRVVNTDSDRDLFTLGGHFNASDLGSPVFLMNDGVSEWAGVIIGITSEKGDTATIIGAQSLKTKQEQEK